MAEQDLLPSIRVHSNEAQQRLPAKGCADLALLDYEQLYANKMDSLEGMDKFLEKYNLSKLNQEEIESMSRPITSMKFEIVIKNLPTKAHDQTDGFTHEFYQKFREEITRILLKLFQGIE